MGWHGIMMKQKPRMHLRSDKSYMDTAELAVIDIPALAA